MSVSRSHLQRWIFSIKPASWPKLLVPTTLGATLGIVQTGEISVQALGVVFGFTILLGLFIVWMNDWADQGVDRIKRAMFAHSSHKTIRDGYLTARQVFFAGASAGFAGVIWSYLASTWIDRPLLGHAALACLSIFVAYSLPPLKLNYRGGGELLETFGVGIALPLYAAYALSGEVHIFAWPLLIGWSLLSLSSALASGLSDEESDRAGGKTTFVTVFGNAPIRKAIEITVILGALCWLVVAAMGTVHLAAVALPALAIFYHTLKLRRLSHAAVTNAFDAQRAYKAELHHAIWRGGLLLVVGLIATQFL